MMYITMTHMTFNAGIMANITMTPRTFIGENHEAHNDDVQNNNAENHDAFNNINSQ